MTQTANVCLVTYNINKDKIKVYQQMDFEITDKVFTFVVPEGVAYSR